MLYGVAANLSRKRLVGVPPMAVAAGSQFSAALLTGCPPLWAWPAASPQPSAWLAAGGAGPGVHRAGPTCCTSASSRAPARHHAISVTFLIPGFAMLWGWLFMGEAPSPTMLAGCAVILLGTALSTGSLRAGGPRGLMGPHPAHT
jgi:drug/metabolite transporter (DMT)-like permease